MGLLGDIGNGLKDGINDGLGKLEDGIDAGKKLVGEGVDWGTDKVGEGLDKVGLHDAADAVEDWGDEVASDLGATPGEQQLGQTEEANELVHGNPDKIRESGKHLKDFHTAFDHVAAGMRKVDSSGWAGEGGDAFRKKFGVHPTKWAEASDACETAAGALEAYADTVKWAQGKAKEAVELYKKGKKTSEEAVTAYNKKVDAYNGKIKANEDPGPKPEPFQDPGTADIKKAHETLAEARKQRNTAASDAQGKVKAALAHAPAEPPPLDRLGNTVVDGYKAYNTELTHVVGGVLKGTAGLVNFARGLNPTDPYNLTHPAAYLQNVSMTLSGLVSTAAHPERIVTAAVDGFTKDPSEFVGRLIPELIGTKGAGLARSGLRMGLKTGAKEGLENGARKAVQKEPHGRTEPSREKYEHDPSDPIDLVTGKMYLPETDIELPGTLPLVFRRRVESGSRLGRWFGPSWTSTLDQRLEVDTEGVILVTEDGLLLAYPHPAPGVPTLPTHGSRHWPLDRVDGGYTVTNPYTGRTWHFADLGEDRAALEQIDDRNGNWITFEHDAEGTPLAVVSSGGHRIEVTVDGDRVTALHLAGAGPDGTDQEIKRYGYSEAGDLTEVVNSSGLPLRFTYDDRGRVTSWTDSNDRSYTYEYDDRDRCVAEGGAAGHMTLRLSYDEVDEATGYRVTTTTDARGHRIRYLIDHDGQVVAETDALGHTTRFTRDRRGRVLTRTDPLGHVTSYRYDEAGDVLAITRPDGREITAEYAESGLPSRIRAADGTVTHHTYDARGNRTSTTGPTGATTVFDYDEAGRPTAVTDPLGHVTTLRCDRAGLPVEITDPLGGVTRYERDAFGRPVRLTDPTGLVTLLEWSVEGHLTRRTAPDGTGEAWAYDGEGNCVRHTDRAGGTTLFEYTHFDLLTARTTPDGVRHTFAHDSELRLTQVAGPHDLTWSYSYDPAGRLRTETDFDGRTLTYTHDAAGRLTSRTDALGRTTSFEHDALGRTVRKDADGQVTTYAYDLTDQVAESAGPDGTRLTILRDQYGRVRSETVDGRELSYEYDLLGRRIGRTTPTGARTTWSYDAAGRPVDLTVSGRALDVTYDAAGRELTCGIGDFLTLENAYDPLGRLLAQSATGPDGGTVQRRAYTYRADGHLAALDDHLDGPRTFDLDPGGRVTAVRATHWTETYAYDAAGNQTTASWPASHPGHEATGERDYTGTGLTRAGAVRYEHDALGRVTLRQKTRLSRKPDTWRYEWDAEDRLARVTTPDGTVWRYTYDVKGRRTAKLRMAADGTTVAQRTTFTWDDTTLCEQTTYAAELPGPVTVTWDHKGLHPVAQTERLGVADAPQEEIDSRFFAVVTDLVGTPRELVDESGAVAWRTRSTLWGTTTWNKDATTYTPLRFPGQYFDPETGLHYNYFRHYDPETARYLTTDPLGLAPAPNASAYVTNPHTVCDPLGLMPSDYKKVTYGESKGAGKDLKRTAQVGDDGWQFNTGHGYDRPHTGPNGVNDLRTTGLTADQIEQGIVNSVYDHMKNGGTVPKVGPGFTGPMDGSMKIGGHDIGYRVSQTPDSVYRVATYWLNP
ncbi:putative T7SS-secreted protein [Streptomyces sp. NPDC102467]|uniref:putative T7SS-secreted protein n=1 Tax=Streptomyces sp. NPDC102467 TaxID=3366179 RepID=UPI00381A630C